MTKLKLNKKEKELLYSLLCKDYQIGWANNLGGHDESNKREEERFQKEMRILKDIISKLA